MPRLFVALELPQAVKALLAGVSSGVTGAKWVKAEQMHLTLRFIGEVDDGVAKALAEALALLDTPRFFLSIHEVGVFPPGRRSPRVLWAGLVPEAPLLALASRVESLVQLAGCAPEARELRPHVTLARLRDPSPGEVRAYLSRHVGLRSEPFPVEEVVLFRSELSSEGARHTVVGKVPLL